MTKLHQILSPSFTTILSQLRQESFTLYHPASMVNRSLSFSTPFCQAVVSCGYLTFEQMLHAACRYPSGKRVKKRTEPHKTAQLPLLICCTFVPVRQESQRVIIYDPFRRHLQLVPQSSSTRSAVILGG